MADPRRTVVLVAAYIVSVVGVAFVAVAVGVLVSHVAPAAVAIGCGAVVALGGGLGMPWLIGGRRGE